MAGMQVGLNSAKFLIAPIFRKLNCCGKTRIASPPSRSWKVNLPFIQKKTVDRWILTPGISRARRELRIILVKNHVSDKNSFLFLHGTSNIFEKPLLAAEIAKNDPS